jgi:signal transduction histidine kinase
VRSLVGRVSFPAELRAAVPVRLEPTIEAAAYFFVSEALTNVGKYANAKSVSVELELTAGALTATVSDDGIGGADFAKGSGLRGLADRVQALGGRLQIESVRGKGTKLRAKLPTKLPGSASA